MIPILFYFNKLFRYPVLKRITHAFSHLVAPSLLFLLLNIGRIRHSAPTIIIICDSEMQHGAFYHALQVAIATECIQLKCNVIIQNLSFCLNMVALNLLYFYFDMSILLILFSKKNNLLSMASFTLTHLLLICINCTSNSVLTSLLCSYSRLNWSTMLLRRRYSSLRR